MIIKFTISHLENVVAALKVVAAESHNAATAAYPSEEYQDHDSESVRFNRAHLFLSNTLDVKYIELGINVLDHNIQYLSSRIKELESFYHIALDSDMDDISNRINEMNSTLLRLRRDYSRALTFDFEIDLDDDVATCLNGIY